MAKISKNNVLILEDDEIFSNNDSLGFNELKERYKGKSIVFDLRDGQECDTFCFFAKNINFFKLKKITVIYDNSISAPVGFFPFFAEPNEGRINYKYEMTPLREFD